MTMFKYDYDACHEHLAKMKRSNTLVEIAFGFACLLPLGILFTDTVTPDQIAMVGFLVLMMFLPALAVRELNRMSEESYANQLDELEAEGRLIRKDNHHA